MCIFTGTIKRQQGHRHVVPQFPFWTSQRLCLTDSTRFWHGEMKASVASPPQTFIDLHCLQNKHSPSSPPHPIHLQPLQATHFLLLPTHPFSCAVHVVHPGGKTHQRNYSRGIKEFYFNHLVLLIASMHQHASRKSVTMWLLLWEGGTAFKRSGGFKCRCE